MLIDYPKIGFYYAPGQMQSGEFHVANKIKFLIHETCTNVIFFTLGSFINGNLIFPGWFC